MEETTKKRELLVRVYIVMIFVVLTALILFGKAVKINVIEGDRWRAKGDSLYLKFMPVVADRGDILAADGALLATSLPFFEIRMDLKADGLTNDLFNKNVDSLSYCLSKYINPNWTPRYYRDYLIKRRAKGDRYLLLAKNVNYEKLEKVKRFPLLRYGPYKGGLIVERQSRRAKPYKMLANRTIGYVREEVQPVGLEGTFDKQLRGEEGKRLMQRVSGGTWIPVQDLSEMEALRGDDLKTTIDIDLQDAVHNALLNGLKYHNALYGTAVLMEVKTGAIRAISNIGATEQGWAENYNYAVGSSNEPGSTFKVAAMMALLEDGLVTPSTRVDLEKGKTRFYREEMYDSHYHGVEDTTLGYAFEISSNVGMAKTVQAVYGKTKNEDRFINRIKKFRLAEKTGIEIAGEGAPKIKEAYSQKDNWSGTTLPWMSIGYEVQVTPIQTLTLFNAIANHGKMMKPYLVSDIMRDGKTFKHFKPKVIDSQIASQNTIRTMQELMLGAVERGTGHRHTTDQYQFAGKTGTARVDYYQKGIDRKMYQASFAGYFPDEKPAYSCIVLIYDPKQNGYYGSSVALPVFREIADKCFALKPELTIPMNLTKTKEKEEQLSFKQNQSAYRTDVEDVLAFIGADYKTTHDGEWVQMSKGSELVLEMKELTEDVLPDVRGMSIRDAVFLLENKGVQVSCSGLGKVTTQSIRPGTKISKGMNVELNLKG